MQILIIGKGAKEYALAKKLKETKETGKYCEEGYTLEGDWRLKEKERVSATSGEVCPSGYLEYNGKCYEEVGSIDSDNYICGDEFKLSNDKVDTDTNESQLKQDDSSQAQVQTNDSKIKTKDKKVILIDGMASSGKTFIATMLAKIYANKKLKVSYVDLTNELGSAEYFSIKLDENLPYLSKENKTDEIKKKSYKCKKNIEVYKGEINDEKALIVGGSKSDVEKLYRQIIDKSNHN